MQVQTHSTWRPVLGRRRLCALATAVPLTLARCGPLAPGARQRGQIPAAPGTAAGVSEARFARLTRGINTSHWFAQAEISPSRFRTYITAEDIQRITDIGFRHIRLSLNPLVLIRVSEPDALQPRVTCNEFGVYRPFAPLDSRFAWLHDVRTSLERYDIGWAMWDYAGGFGVVAERDGRRVVHTATVHALGL